MIEVNNLIIDMIKPNFPLPCSSLKHISIASGKSIAAESFLELYSKDCQTVHRSDGYDSALSAWLGIRY